MPQVYGKTSQILPTPSSDGSQVQIRLDRYGDQVVLPITAGLYGLSAEGSYFRATNPTIGTGIAMGIQTAFSETANILALIRNTDVAGGKFIYLDYIRLVCVAAGATTTASHFAMTMDTSNRYSSGGSQLIGVNSNSGVSTASIADIRFGAVTALAASGSRRILSRAVLKTAAAPTWVIGDEILINFGAQDAAMGLLSGTAASRFGVPVGPLLLAPGNNHSLLIHMWNVGNATTPPSWEVEMGFWER